MGGRRKVIHVMYKLCIDNLQSVLQLSSVQCCLLSVINPRRACAERVTVVVPCVFVSVRSFLPTRACRSQNVGTNRFTAMQKNLL